MEKQWKQWQRLYFLGLQKSLQMVTAAMKLRCLLLGSKPMTNLDSILKSRDITLATKVRLVKPMVFFSNQVWMWELDHKKSWAPKNWCFWTVVLEKTLETPLYCKEIKPVNPQGNQSWIFTGRTDADIETPILWPPVVKNWLIWKDPGAGKDWRQEEEEEETTEDEMAGWDHRLDGREFEHAPGVGDGKRSLVCCSSWGHKSWTRRLSDWTELITGIADEAS